jgi:hypothetical protein
MITELKKLHIQLLTRLAKDTTITRDDRMSNKSAQYRYLEDLKNAGYCVKEPDGHGHTVFYSMTVSGRAKLREIVGQTWYTIPWPRDRQPVEVQS